MNDGFETYRENIHNSKPEQTNPKVEAKNPQEIKDRNQEPLPGSPIEDGGHFLFRILHSTPFLDLFEKVADRLYAGRNLPTKVMKLKVIHPWFFHISIYMELLVHALAILLILGFAGVALLKLILPLC